MFVLPEITTGPERLLLEATMDRNRRAVVAARFELDDTWTHDVGEVNLRFVYLLPIEDFARHAGHGDILREQLTGR